MAEFTRRLWFELTATGYVIEIRDGARIRHREAAEATLQEADAKIRELAVKFKVDDVCRGI